MIRPFRKRARMLLALSSLAWIASCGGTDEPTPSGGPDGVRPLYAVLSLVSTTDSTTSYVNLFASPDVPSLDFSKAREFAGSTGADTIDGKLFISSGEAPTVTRFGVTDDMVWKDEGTVNFSNYGGSSPLWTNGFGGGTKAYMTFNVVDRVVWDPRALSLVHKQTAGADLVRTRDGFQVRAAYDRALVTRDGGLYWPYYWSDDDYFRFSQSSQIAVYDTGTDQIRALIDTPCPGLDFATRDEEGNLYFSNWVFTVAAPLFAESAPRNCMVRVKAGEQTIDPSFTVRFADVTEGREAAAFHYLGNGQGFFAVFHKERVEVRPDTDPKTVIYGDHWRFWSFDLATRVAKPMDGIDYFAGGYRPVKIDGRTFLLLPRADYASTDVYEVFPDATAKKLYASPGWVYQFIRVR